MASLQERFAQPQPVTKLDLAFGGPIRELMPSYAELPEDFRRERDQFSELVSKWFFSGLDVKKITPKDGIDRDAALRHCGAIMCSFEPKHEHKIAGVAWLMSQWFDRAGATK